MEKEYKLTFFMIFFVLFTIFNIFLLMPWSLYLIFGLKEYIIGPILLVISFGEFQFWGYNSLYNVVTRREYHGLRKHRRKGNDFMIAIFVFPFMIIVGSWILISQVAPLNLLNFIVLLTCYHILPPVFFWMYKKIDFEMTPPKYQMNGRILKQKELVNLYEDDTGKVAILDEKETKGFKTWKKEKQAVKFLPQIILNNEKNFPLFKLKKIPLYNIREKDKEIAYIYYNSRDSANDTLTITQDENWPKKFLIKNLKDLSIVFKNLNIEIKQISIQNCTDIRIECCSFNKLKLLKTCFDISKSNFKKLYVYRCKNSKLNDNTIKKFNQWDCVNFQVSNNKIEKSIEKPALLW